MIISQTPVFRPEFRPFFMFEEIDSATLSSATIILSEYCPLDHAQICCLATPTEPARPVAQRIEP